MPPRATIFCNRVGPLSLVFSRCRNLRELQRGTPDGRNADHGPLGCDLRGGVGVGRTAPASFANINPGTVPIARVQAFLGIGAALVGLVGVLLPHPAEFDETGLLATQAASFICGAALLLAGGRVPIWTLHGMPVVATLLTTLSIIFTSDPTSAYAMFYLWVGLYSFYFLSRFEAVLQIAFVIVSYATALAILDGGGSSSPPNPRCTTWSFSPARSSSAAPSSSTCGPASRT